MEEKEFEIPGLIAKENSSKGQDRNLFEEGKMVWRTLAEEAAMKKQVTKYVSGVDPYQQGSDNMLLNNYMYQPWDQKTPPFGPYIPPAQKTGIDEIDIHEHIRKLAMEKNIQYSNPKSEFEKLIDELFSRQEKEQMLIDMGYMLEAPDNTKPGYMTNGVKITRKLADGTIKTITNTLDQLFLKEVTVKFKNLLLAKATLKLKL